MGPHTPSPVAIVHDYLTQRGGAERVVGSMLEAFPAAPVHTALYDPSATFPLFGRSDVRSLPINRLGPLRRHHRLALPLLAPAFSLLHVDAEVTICSSSGWAHGVRVSGRKVVYCYTPARWLYQTDRYLSEKETAGRAAITLLRSPLCSWDRRRALSAHRYLVISTAVRERVRRAYGVDAEILPPPVTLDPAGQREPVEGVEPGFWLCVSRLLPYKNVDAIIEAFAGLPAERLVIVGSGPDEPRLRASATPNVRFAGRVDDSQLRWLYANCQALVTASHEDFGLTPLEANSFGKPVAALSWGGFLDTVVDGLNGLLFDQPTPESIRDAASRVSSTDWLEADISGHVRRYSQERFASRLRQIVDEEVRA